MKNRGKNGFDVADVPANQPSPIPCFEPCENVYWFVGSIRALTIMSGTKWARYLRHREPQQPEPISITNLPPHQIYRPEYGGYKEDSEADITPENATRELLEEIHRRYKTGFGELQRAGNCEATCTCIDTAREAQVKPAQQAVVEIRVEWDEYVDFGTAAPLDPPHLAPPPDMVLKGNNAPVAFDDRCDVLKYLRHTGRRGTIEWGVVRRFDGTIKLQLNYEEKTVAGECLGDEF